ncbi:uncharacterized protein LOC141617318 [Silene latifolia]|uniref:uncharacterized protein LOC141617318 n=1 Tax=Silene latifolia TaxID=37657 RepID=UPI003D787E8F
MTLYDGTEDLLEHINQYKQKMMVGAATRPEKEACMCKGFGSTLSGAALQWVSECFQSAVRKHRKPEKLSNDLYQIVQRFEESTRDYLAIFNVKKISIPRCDPTTAVNAFRRGLHRDSDLYKDLMKHPCATFEEVKLMAEATYLLEEDEDRRDLYGTESSSRKITTERKNERAKPYSKNTVNKVSGETEITEAPPNLSEYGFTTGLAGVSYSAAKRHATETKGDKPEFSLRVSRQDLLAISFNEADVPDKAEHHYDTLIITLSRGNFLVKKILVDTGSFVNLIMLETLKNMGFSEKDLVKKAVPLVGFSGETKQSLGEIVVPTFAGGMNKQVRYLVIDGLSTYNVILGRH